MMGRVFNMLSGRKFSAVSLFFILGVLIFSFLLSGCGKGPQTKVLLSNKGAFAIRLPAIESTEDREGFPSGTIFREGVVSMADPRMGIIGFNFIDTSFTVEAWIKPERITSGVIFVGGNLDPDIPDIASPFGTDGYVLYLWQGADPDSSDGNTQAGCHTTDNSSKCVKFAIKSNGTWYVATATYTSDLLDAWHHVAGVFDKDTGILTVYVDGTALPDADNNHPNPQTNVPAITRVGASLIGANLVFKPDETLLGIPGDNSSSEFAPNNINGYFKGTVDEARIWSVTRTEAQINECMIVELEIEGEGNCMITVELATYLTFNVGTGSLINDFSGGGNNGLARFYSLKPAGNDPREGTFTWDPGSNWVDGRQF